MKRFAASPLPSREQAATRGPLQTTATKQGDHFVLNGNKIFITNGAEASIVVVFATEDKSKGTKGISAFIVESNTPGFSVGKLEHKMGIHGSSTAELVFENCKIPKANQLGESGKGLRYAMEAIDSSRVTVAAQALGISQAAFDDAISYAKTASSSANRLHSTRPSSGCWPIWPLRSMRPGCWFTAQPG